MILEIPHYLPVAFKTPSCIFSNLLKKWWAQEDLNLRPPGYEQDLPYYITLKFNNFKLLIFSFIGIRHHSGVKLPVIPPSPQEGML